MDKHQDAKRATSYRLTPEAKELLAVLAKKLGISRGAVLEVLIREKAKRERMQAAKTVGQQDTG